MKKFKLFIAALFLAASTVNADTIKLGVENISYLPYYTSEDGIYSGFAHELFEMFAEHSGHEIEYLPLPVSRLFGDFVAGKLDWKFPDNPKWKQDMKKSSKINYSKEVVEYTDGIFVKKDKLNTGKVAIVGTVRGFTPWPLMDQIQSKKIKIVENNDLPALFKMLTLGRVEGVYANRAVGQYQLIKTNYNESIEFDDSLTKSTSSYFVGAVNKKELIEEFNSFMKDKSQQINSLKAKYLIN